MVQCNREVKETVVSRGIGGKVRARAVTKQNE